jgi:hypothetical protein
MSFQYETKQGALTLIFIATFRRLSARRQFTSDTAPKDEMADSESSHGLFCPLLILPLTPSFEC